jgi:UDP-N-acetylglucosamine 2-epimerase (non-hydrolysing)
MKILLAFGTRPEIIKLGPVYQALLRAGVETEAFWSGQHVELAAGLLEFFAIDVAARGQDVVNEAGLAGKFGLMVQQIVRQLETTAYDWIVVQGDTGTAAAAALAGFMSRVPVAHVEAGLRTGDLQSPWPEEFNRRLAGLAATLHFAPTTQARDNLLSEGIPADRTYVVGNTVVDAVLFARAKIRSGYAPINKQIASLPADKKLILATLHRRENIGEPLRRVLRALRTLANDGDKLIILPVHLNPQVRAEVVDILGNVPNIWLVEPLQYADFVYLLDRCWTIVTDSGGVQEEAPTFGRHILITRESTERPEVVTAGFGTLVGSDYGAIVSNVRRLTRGDRPQILTADNPFGRGDASDKIAARLTAANQQALAAAQ